MKIKLLGPLLALSILPFTASATEYIFRDLMANTLPSPGCIAEPEAIKKATSNYNLNSYSKKFCQTQGYGWHVAEIKDTGKAVCQECSNSDNALKKCHVEDVVVSCKRIKPGTVGLLPGKG
ncbi:MAG: hypothetical protein ACU84H_01155 [Gammaproteobacteria bacterium]